MRKTVSLVLAAVLILLLSACRETDARRLTLQPFSCDAAFVQNGQTYVGQLQYKDPQQISFSFSEPQRLCGLVLQMDAAQYHLRFGEAAVDLSSLSHLPLAPFAPQRLLRVLSMLGAQSFSLNARGTTTGVCGDMTYELQFDPRTRLLQSLKTDDDHFIFTHTAAADA